MQSDGDERRERRREEMADLTQFEWMTVLIPAAVKKKKQKNEEEERKISSKKLTHLRYTVYVYFFNHHLRLLYGNRHMQPCAGKETCGTDLSSLRRSDLHSKTTRICAGDSDAA